MREWRRFRQRQKRRAQSIERNKSVTLRMKQTVWREKKMPMMTKQNAGRKKELIKGV